MPSSQREQWSSRAGFLLAAIGSAVGLGNMWRFSYLAAENGGAAFVILYLGVTAVVGLPVLLAEFAIGRGAQQSPIRALAHFGGPAWRPLGIVFVCAGFLILSYYSVIAGWTLRYAGIALFEGFRPGSADHFGAIASGWGALGLHLAVMLVTILIVAGGVRAGIERTSVVLMPALFAIVVGLACYAWTLDGGGPGYAYYLRADFEKVLSLQVLKDAAGQAFFSLSLGMGAMLTYGSYLGRDNHLPNEALVIGGADTSVAFVAGLVVFPMIFALGLADRVSESTVGALFITLPEAFAAMGAAGRIVGLAFFVVLLVGALTSAISLLEVVVSAAIDGLGWSRRRAAWVAGASIAALGIPPAFSLDALGAMDEVANNVFLLGGGLALAVFVGWVMKDPMETVRPGAEGVQWFGLWRVFLRFAVPLFLLLVLSSAIPHTFETVSGLFASGSAAE